MLDPREITEPGFYWYIPSTGAAPAVIEVVGQQSEQLSARFIGREGDHLLSDVAGTFVGPLRAPSATFPGMTKAESRKVRAELERALKILEERMKPPRQPPHLMLVRGGRQSV